MVDATASKKLTTGAPSLETPEIRVTPGEGELAGLDASQRAAVTHEASALAILAPAGSGKTRVLTRRIAYRIRGGTAESTHSLALTFTRQAARELRSRLTRLDVQGSVTAGTFHAVALASLRRMSEEQHREMPGILDRKGRILFSMVGRSGAAAHVAVQELASEIEWAKARLVTPDRYVEVVARRDQAPARPAGEVAELYEQYEQEKRRRRVVDFDDLLWWCASEIESNATFAEQARHRFRHFFVDEFQDVNPAQWRLLRSWLAQRSDITVVGDEAQAIYGFAGADPRYLNRFDELVPGAARTRLSSNYRSTPQIVAASNAVLGAASGVARPLPTAVAEAGPRPTITAYADDRAEAAGVARALAKAHQRDVRWGGLAVLYRTNAQSGLIEAALRRADIPIAVAGTTRFADRPEVRALLDELAGGKGGSFADHIVDLEAIAAGDEPGHGAERREHAAALAELARGYLETEGPVGSLGDFTAWLTANTHGDDTPSADAVAAMTFHRAKGLEWPIVFAVGLERGLMPISHASGAAALAEERRLLHVALSRSQRELHLSWAQTRRRGGRDMSRSASPYLDLVAAANEPGPHDRVGDPRRGLAAVRAAAAAAGPSEDYDPDLFDALRAWRRREAIAHDLPAYTVFADATLKAIAAQAPRTDGDLLTISGIGPVKLERYGPHILTIVGDHAPEPVSAEISAKAATAGAQADSTGPERRASEPAARSARGDPLFEALRAWRRRESSAAETPAYTVLSDAVLAAVTFRRPVDDDDLLAIAGIGPVKLARYGDDLLRIVADHPESGG